MGGAGGGGGVRVSCQLLPSIILSWRGNQYSSLFVLSPNVPNLEKKEQNPDKCILFSNSKCCIRFHPHADASASSRLPSAAWRAWAACHHRWRCLPQTQMEPLKRTAGSPPEVTCFPKKKFPGHFLQEEHSQHKTVLA